MKLKNALQKLKYRNNKALKTSVSLTFAVFVSLNVFTISRGFGQGCETGIDFSQGIITADNPAVDTWYTYNYNPGGFSAPTNFGGEDVLQMLIITEDGQFFRQPPFDTEEFNTQGRQIDLPIAAQSASIDLFIDPSWASTDRTLSNIRFEAVKADNSSLELVLQLYSFDEVLYLDVFFGEDSYNLASAIQLNAWLTIGMSRANDGSIIFNIGNDEIPNPAGQADQINRIANIGIAGVNTFSGVTYTLAFDNLTYTLQPDGCTDSGACNYAPNALCDDGSCEFTSCAGCTDPLAQNYDVQATIDDASCLFLPQEYVGLSYELIEIGSVPGYNTYQVYLELNDPLAELIAIFGVVDNQYNAPLIFTGTGNFFQSPDGGNLSSSVLPALFPFVPELEFDSYLTIGALPGNSTVTQVGLSADAFDSSGLLVNDAVGAVIYVIPGTEPAAIAGLDGKILVAQVTISGDVEMTFNFQFNNAIGETQQVFQVSVNLPGDEVGCTDELACNYNPLAIFEDNSCEFPSCGDPVACNYNVNALCTDASLCILPNGCTDQGACNYDSSATCDNGSCDYITCAGCTNPDAFNYDDTATIDDGSCNVPPAVYVGLEYELSALNSVSGFNTYHVYLQLNDPTAELISIYGVNDNAQTAPLELAIDGAFYQNGNGGDIASQINPLLFDFDPNLAFDSYLAIGAAEGNGTLFQTGLASGSFTASGLLVDSETGASVFVIPDSEPLATAGVDERVFIGQFTVNGTADLLLNFVIRDADGVPQTVRGAQISFPINEQGCMDGSACNYNPLAVIDDNSCLYPSCANIAACNYDPAANCSDESLCILPDGCTNPLACNYDDTAICDDGSCNLPDGCTNLLACNYDAAASCDDGSCILPDGCTQIGACNFNPVALCDDGSCDFISCAGCMDVLATNYDVSASINAGCTYGTQTVVYATADQTGEAGNLAIGSEQFATSAYPGIAVALKAHSLNGNDIVPTGNVYSALGGNGVDQNAVEVVGFGTWNFAALINLGALTFDQVEVVIDVDFDPAETYISAEAFQFNASDYIVNTVGASASSWGISENLGSSFWSNFSDPNILPFNSEAAGTYNVTLRVISNLGVEVANVGIIVDVFVEGCTYAFAANFNPLANVDNGSCVFEGCTDSDALNFNPLANSDNGSCVDPILGCTVSNATNFNPLANSDNGTCEFICAEDTCPADFNNDEIVNVNDLLVFLVAFGNPCQ